MTTILWIVAVVCLRASRAAQLTIVDGSITHKNGVAVSTPTFVGTTLSALQAVINNPSYFPAIKTSYPPTVLVYDESLTHTLTISGTYTADVPISLPSQFVLQLNSSTIAVSSKFHSTAHENGAEIEDAVILLRNTWHSAVLGIGGPSVNSIVCGKGSRSPAGILVYQSSYAWIDSITVDSCGLDEVTSAITLYLQTSNVEVSNCALVNNARAVWLLVATRCYVHDNYIKDNTKHTVDLDAFVARSVVASNTIVGSTQEGIFIEQGTKESVAFGNSLSGNEVGIGVFNMQFNSNKFVQNTVILNNNIANNKVGLKIGSNLGKPTPEGGNCAVPPSSSACLWDVNMTVLSNTFLQNGRDAYPNGVQEKTLYSSNVNSAGPLVVPILKTSTLLSTDANQTQFLPGASVPSNAFSKNAFPSVTTVSALNSLLQSLPSPPSARDQTVVDGRFLSYVQLNGNYIADVPLVIPQQTVVLLEGTIEAPSKANLAALVSAAGPFSAVVGDGAVAAITCNKRENSIGVLATGSDFFRLDGVAVSGCTTGVLVQAGLAVEVANNLLQSNKQGVVINGAQRPYVHDNNIVSNSEGGLSLAGDTFQAVVHGNTISKNGNQGLLIGNDAMLSVVTSNIFTENTLGVALYETTGPKKSLQPALQGHILLKNQITLNKKGGIKVAFSSATSKGADLMFLSNSFSSNGVSDIGVAGGNQVFVGNNPFGFIQSYAGTTGTASGGLTYFDPFGQVTKLAQKASAIAVAVRRHI